MYYKEEKLGVDEIAKTIGVSKMTLYKYLRLRGVPISAYQSKTGKI
jgi:predicted DNA-binding transcriptional regulator YafY